MIRKIAFVIAISAPLTAQLAHAENVEIYLMNMLDNTQSGYCIDIARAQGAKANPDDGLQGHTCYSPKGELMVDQIFDTDKFAEGVLFMPEFNVCVELESTDAGSAIGLAACNGSAEQSFQFSGEGTIVPSSAPDMCVTVAEDTSTGKSDVNQKKVLSLETCSDDKTAFQKWAVRTAI